MNLRKYKNIHFIGIGGISMSALAEILNKRGYKVQGSDFQITDMTQHLNSVGIKVFFGHDGKNIAPETDLIVYNAAIGEDNPERIEGKRRGIDEIDRAELIGWLMHEYECPISIAGTHGKTTTSSMISEILMKAKTDPTVSIGGILPSIHSNYRLGSSKYIVLETCEYRDSFLKFNPACAVILNIDRDHTDYFKTMEQMYVSFNAFVKRTDDFIVINNEIPDLSKVTDGFDGRIITYGKSGADWTFENLRMDKGFGKYTACQNGRKIMDVELSVPGKHNVYNSLGAVALCTELGIGVEAIHDGLKSFTGTGRRFEKKGEYNGAVVVDDYAHHPTEIAATLSAAKEMGFDRVIAVFQPHTYTRTRDLFDGFVNALSLADKTYLIDIYAAREKDPGDINSAQLSEALIHRGKTSEYSGSFDSCIESLKAELGEGDLILTIGAGTVFRIADALVKD